MAKKITNSVPTPIGKSFSDMIADVDNSTISISSNTEEGVTTYTFKARVSIYANQAALDNGSTAVMTEYIVVNTTNIANVQKKPYGIIETELAKKYTLV